MAPVSDELSQDIELMTRVASLYYLEDVHQAEIAERLGLSRIKVGRLLKKARETGIVEIKIHTHPLLSLPLEAELRARFGLEQALLAAEQPEESLQRAAVGQRVASYMVQRLQEGMTVTVGMGRNVGAVADYVGNSAPRACLFVSAIGGSLQVGQQVNPAEVCRRLALCFGGRSEALYAPAYAENPQARAHFLQHEDVRRTLEQAAQADIALVGIGDARDDSAVVRMGCFSSQDMDQMRRAGAVGDILGFFFDRAGRAVAHSMEDRVIGLGAEALRRIPLVIGIASERDKDEALLGALRTGILNVLATGVGTARRLMTLSQNLSTSSGDSA